MPSSMPLWLLCLFPVCWEHQLVLGGVCLQCRHCGASRFPSTVRAGVTSAHLERGPDLTARPGRG